MGLDPQQLPFATYLGTLITPCCWSSGFPRLTAKQVLGSIVPGAELRVLINMLQKHLNLYSVSRTARAAFSARCRRVTDS